MDIGSLSRGKEYFNINPTFTTEALIDPPTLMSPSYGAILSDDTPYLEWVDDPYANLYEVQVDSDFFFSSPIDFTATTFHNYIECSSLADDTYIWRVRARDYYNDWTAWSVKWVFTIDTFAPKSPTLNSPENGFITDSKDLDFSWNPVADGE